MNGSKKKYDFYLDEENPRDFKKNKYTKKEKNIVLEEYDLNEYTRLKQKGKNRRANQQKDKEKYQKKDRWN